MPALKLIQLSTGKILGDRDPQTAGPQLKDQALFDPKTQEYDPARKRLRTKTPDLSHTLPYKVDALEARVATLEQQLAILLQRTSPKSKRE